MYTTKKQTETITINPYRNALFMRSWQYCNRNQSNYILYIEKLIKEDQLLQEINESKASGLQIMHDVSDLDT